MSGLHVILHCRRGAACRARYGIVVCRGDIHDARFFLPCSPGRNELRPYMKSFLPLHNRDLFRREAVEGIDHFVIKLLTPASKYAIILLQASARFVEVAGDSGSPSGWDPRTWGLH